MMALSSRALIRVFIIALLGLVVACISTRALGFPEMARHGYQSCSTCHVQASGGGAITAYGRMISKSALSTWSGGIEAIEIPDWLDYGANYRYANVNTKDRETGVKTHVKFPMQSEAEIAVEAIKGLTIDAAIGTYGPNQTQAMVRNYGQLRLHDAVYARFGRFEPAFGINDPDHTLWTRSKLGFGERAEQYGIETSVVTKWGEAIVSQMVGDNVVIQANQTDGYKVTEAEHQRTYGRFSVYALKTVQVGGSIVFDKQTVIMSGIQGFASYTDWLYSDFEFDQSKELGLLTYVKLGVEPYRGIHLYATSETMAHEFRPGVGIQWFPVQGIDLLFRARQEKLLNEYTAIFHSYL